MKTLREQLSQARAFPNAERVSVEETHVSWVFLTEREAFKVKKPVDLGFLSYATLAKRKAACESELVLNRRLSPDVYLGVEPVVEQGGTLFVGQREGEARVVDWAVRMRRLSDRDRADVLLEQGSLGPAEIDRLARHIATFHATAKNGPSVEALGAPTRIAFNVEENFAQTRTELTRFLRPEEAVEIVSWQRRFLREHAHAFERRVREGHVRDGHGDLRLEHVYFERDGAARSERRVAASLAEAEIRVLDCIEFDERFRYADTAADLAFLAMDLEWRGRVDLAERLLATYAAESGDYGLYDVVDFYVAYRAFVRGKIAVLLATDAGAPVAVRERAAVEARRYFMVALAADRQPTRPTSVTAVGGLVAAGKSTAAEAIAKKLCAPIVCADRTRKQMLGVPALARVSPGTFQGAYDPAFTREVYAEMLRRAEHVLGSRRPVILDASFRSETMRAEARGLAKRAGVPFRFVECRAPLATLRSRLDARDGVASVSDARAGILDEFAARFEAVTELPPDEHVIVDTTRPLDETLGFLGATVDTCAAP